MERKMNRAIRLSALFCVLVLAVVSGSLYAKNEIMPPSPAYDAKSFSGTECQPTYGSQISDLRYYSSEIYNDSSSYYRYVTCPVMRDDAWNTDGVFSWPLAEEEQPFSPPRI
jgi:hypothetical protein